MNQIEKNALIGAMIRKEFNDNGGDVVAAFDKLFGVGSYSKLAGEVYHALRAKQGL